MANTQDTQTKELLEKNSIRTMRKDIQKLRELDSLQESRRIVQLKAPSQEAPEKPPQIREKIEAILKEKREKDEAIMKQARTKATEIEKQRIFSLESQKAVLKGQQSSDEEREKSLLAVEKNSIVLEQENIRKKLKPIIQGEERVEAKLREIEEREQAAPSPQEKQSLEQQRWKLEEQRKKIEKERWLLEKNLHELEEKMRGLDTHFQQIAKDEQNKKATMVAIEDSLRQVHSDIIKRAQSEEKQPPRGPQIILKKEELKPKMAAPRKENRPPAKPLEKHAEKPSTKPENALRREPSPNIKEKLQQSMHGEEDQRKKFLEDVETWVVATKKQEKM